MPSARLCPHQLRERQVGAGQESRAGWAPGSERDAGCRGPHSRWPGPADTKPSSLSTPHPQGLSPPRGLPDSSRASPLLLEGPRKKSNTAAVGWGAPGGGSWAGGCWLEAWASVWGVGQAGPSSVTSGALPGGGQSRLSLSLPPGSSVRGGRCRLGAGQGRAAMAVQALLPPRRLGAKGWVVAQKAPGVPGKARGCRAWVSPASQGTACGGFGSGQGGGLCRRVCPLPGSFQKGLCGPHPRVSRGRKLPAGQAKSLSHGPSGPARDATSGTV